MSFERRRVFGGMVSILALAVVLPACGGGSNSGGGGTGPSTPAGPSQASITVGASTPTVSLSPRAGYTYRITVPVTLTETAGLGANINFLRLSLTLAGAEIERSEISSADLIASTGTNRLAASSTRTFNAIFDANAGEATGGLLIVNATDDRGNSLQATFAIAF